MALQFPQISLADEHSWSFRLDYFGLLFACLQEKSRDGKEITLTETQSQFVSKQTSHQRLAIGGKDNT